MTMMTDTATLRGRLGLSRSELSRFLGVSEPTVVRWESDRAVSEPRGLQAVLHSVLAEAVAKGSEDQAARIVRDCSLDHRVALRRLLDLVE